MNLTPTCSPVIMKMRSHYISATDKFELEAAKKSEVWQIRSYLHERYHNVMKITEHCAVRLNQRLSSEEYRLVLAEVAALAKNKMFKKMFVGKQKNVNIVLRNNVTIGFSLADGNRLIVKTVFKRAKENVH